MSAAKCSDYLSCCPGLGGRTSDVVRAYAQAFLVEAPTWIRFPKDEWHQMLDPHFPLVLALRGHPDSGLRWVRECDESLFSVRFQVSRNDKLATLLLPSRIERVIVVYVDDSILGGRKANLNEIRKLLSEQFDLETPLPAGRLLECEAQTFDVLVDPSLFPVSTK
jgi:hypothetical protein